MCGNGIRCFYKALQYWKMHDQWPIDVQTDVGVLTLDESSDWMIRVDMWKPRIGEYANFTIDAYNYAYRNVSMWNPHCILVSETEVKYNRTQVCEIGSCIESMTNCFPEKTNVEFVRVTDELLDLQVWERWCGYTLACGTGACATVVGLIVEKIIEPWNHRVKLPGWELSISRDGYEESSVMMAGPAEFVFEWSITL
jgi:diaminopimelate epimerase